MRTSKKRFLTSSAGIDHIMWKPLPVWLFLFCVLLGSIFFVAFGWCVKNAASGLDRFGRLGDISLVVASFPDRVSYFLKVVRADRDEVFRVPQIMPDSSGFYPVQMKSGIHVKGLMVRADEAALARAPGWRLLVGAFTIDDEIQNAALVLSPELQIVHMWILIEGEVQGHRPRPEHDKFVHGFAILKDGSIIITFDGGVSTQRIDRCGSQIWSTSGPFNHTVAPEEDEKSVWTIRELLKNVEIVQVATANGAIVRRIPIGDIIEANPMIDILGVRQKDEERFGGGTSYSAKKWEYDPFHFNDVEPLPSTIAGKFGAFKAGDLLLSARSLNLIFVIDPTSLKVEWWHSGAWRQQHDPDWQPTGEITVYDNRMGREYSRIVSIAPASRDTEVLFNGDANSFYSMARGKHQLTAKGNLLITSPAQGRVFEVDSSGRTVFEIFNTKPGSKEFNYLISEAIWLPSEFFDFAKDVSCPN